MPKKILIVDDEPHIRLLLEQILEEFEDKGVEILSTDNGLAAMEIIKAEAPELVYLDVMMPGMNGFDVCNTVKNELKMKDIYIVMLTAKGEEVDKQKGKEACADIYITKPFDPDVIKAKAFEILKIEREN